MLRTPPADTAKMSVGFRVAEIGGQRRRQQHPRRQRPVRKRRSLTLNDRARFPDNESRFRLCVSPVFSVVSNPA
jgi:hypothetical protein